MARPTSAQTKGPNVLSWAASRARAIPRIAQHGLVGAKQSYAMEIATKPLVMASEIAGLAPLHGFIKQENRVVPAHFELAKKRGKQPEFANEEGKRRLPEI